MKIPAGYLLVLAMLFWSGNYVIGKAVVATVPPITLAYVRWLLAFCIFLPFCWAELKTFRDEIRRHWLFFVVLGATGIIGYNIFQYLAVKYTTAINATIINSSTPIFVAIASYVFMKDRLSPLQAFGISISFFGVTSIITQNNWMQVFSMTYNIGDFMMLLGVWLNTVYLLILRKKGKLVPPKVLFICSIFGGLVVAFPLFVWENSTLGTGWISQLNHYHFWSLLYLGIFPTILAMLFYNRGIMEIGPVKTAIYANLTIVFTAILGFFFLGERLNPAHFLGAALIITGVWLTNKKQPVKNNMSSGQATS
jgi:drug/metabolite transporter (DMT)-like permease